MTKPKTKKPTKNAGEEKTPGRITVKVGSLDDTQTNNVLPKLAASDSRVSELETLNADLEVERDGLAARVLELEEQAAPAVSLLAEYKAFISNGLKTGAWNNTIATELLKK